MRPAHLELVARVEEIAAEKGVEEIAPLGVAAGDRYADISPVDL